MIQCCKLSICTAQEVSESGTGVSGLTPGCDCSLCTTAGERSGYPAQTAEGGWGHSVKQDGAWPVLQRRPRSAAVESPTGSLNHRSGSSFSVAGKDEPE